MATYVIQSVWDGPPNRIEHTKRSRRDAAALAYETAIWQMLDALALRDTKHAWAVMAKAKQAYGSNCLEHDTDIAPGYKVRFWRN